MTPLVNPTLPRALLNTYDCYFKNIALFPYEATIPVPNLLTSQAISLIDFVELIGTISGTIWFLYKESII